MLVVSAFACLAFAVIGWRAGAPEPIPFPLALGALLVGAAVAIASARALDRFRESLAERQRELAALTSRLMSAQEEERRRISRELHDELGQSLTAINAHLWLVERALPESTPLRTQTAEARRLLARTLAAMRELSHLPRPSVLGELRLEIEDDGIGVASSERRDPRGGTGLVGIRERVRALGGTVAVHSGKGVRLDIRLPLT